MATTSLGSIPENFTPTAVYDCPSLSALPALVYAVRPTFTELVWDADGGFTSDWVDRSSVTGSGPYVFHLARRAFSGAGLAIYSIDKASLGGGSTSGPVGGDLSGTTSAATVTKLQGRTVATTAPTDGQGLVWDNTAGNWKPATIPDTTVAGVTADMTGHVDGQVLTFVSGSIKPSTPSTTGWTKVVDTNFTQLGTISLGTDGQYTINGNPYQIRNNARATSFGISSSGLVIQCNTQSSANYFLDASTGPQVAIKLKDIAPNFVLGQSQVRMWCLAGSNGNSNHENCGFGAALYPWGGDGTSNTKNWYSMLAYGAYDSINPHNGIIVGHASGQSATSRTDKDLTSVTVANDPTRSIWGYHFRDVGTYNFYYKSLGTGGVSDTLANSSVANFQDLTLCAQVGPTPGSTYTINGAQTINDPTQWWVGKVDDIQLLILSVSTYNTLGHMIATLKRLVIEVKY